jgi:hypothetical protein
MGLEIASWLVNCGARKIALVARHGLSLEKYQHSETAEGREIVSRIAKMEAQGAEVHVLPIDVSEMKAATSLGKAIDDLRLSPVKGVIHAAGVAEYHNLDRCPPEAVAAVMAPKVAGGLVLDKIFAPGTLDFFIMTSSFGQLVGFPGKLSYAPANASLDELASERRRRTDNCTSIQWTSWKGVGLAAQNASATRMINKGMTARGFSDISPDQALEALDFIISSVNTDQVAVVRLLELEEGQPCRHPILRHITPRRKAISTGSSAALVDYPEHAVAVVGMAARTAAGSTVDDLWHVISKGKSMEREVDEERFPEIRSNGKKMWGNLLKDVDSFDHQFFKKSKREAAALHPH